MIVAKDSVKEYVNAQKDWKAFSEEIGIARSTLYNIIEGKNVSSDVVAKLLTKTGFEFEKAFEVKED